MVIAETVTITGHLQLIYNSPCIASIVLNHIVIVLHNSETDMKWPMINKAVADGPVGQVLAGPVSECNKNILIISITMLT